MKTLKIAAKYVFCIHKQKVAAQFNINELNKIHFLFLMLINGIEINEPKSISIYFYLLDYQKKTTSQIIPKLLNQYINILLFL